MEGPNLVVTLAPALPVSGLLQGTAARCGLRGRRRGRPGPRRGGRRGRRRLHGRQAERQEVALQHLAQVLEKAPPVGHLDRIGRPLADPLGIGLRAVADGDLDARMGAQPCREGLGGSVGEEVHRPPALQVA